MYLPGSAIENHRVNTYIGIMNNYKPPRYWSSSKERCAKEALKYQTRSAFGNGSSGACIAARKKGWLDDICGHMENKKKPGGYWTREHCQEEALKYQTRSAFGNGSSGAYVVSRKRGWLDDVCGHMVSIKKPNGYWTKDRCVEEALKYQTRYEFEVGTISAYNAARRGGWVDDICEHMVSPYKPPGYWTREHCQEEALKYQTRSAFGNGSSGAYSAAQRNKWLDDVCSHMKRIGNIATRGIYAIVFTDDRLVYVGLSANPEKRIRSHKHHSSNRHVRRLISEGSHCEFKIFDGWYDKDRAACVEQETIEIFEHEGYGILNISKAGALGGNRTRWTLDKCMEEAMKYKTRGEFNKGSSAYKAAYVNGWLNDICGHMVSPYKSPGYWTKEKCTKEALKYTARYLFSKGGGTAYNVARKNGWLDGVCSHMKNNNKPAGYWTKDHCVEEALKYETRSQFSVEGSGAYYAAGGNGWLDDICGHMEDKKKPPGYWTREHCHEEALKYQVRSTFRDSSGGAYNVARKNGWLDGVCNHMKIIKRPISYWTFHRCKEEASKYESRSKFKNGCSGAYQAVRTNGWLDELYS